ncbi:MAG TPA: ABC transporter ATP-binding protein [Geminicoccaceae bacterium]|nr:ABC transporter ATP-binding protein [Geminicoccus sp.]HMU53134.1 ABC transporter ATP-binding protein [Geminicoccaceae bacterium]
MSLLELRGLTKRYGDVTALRGIDLTIAAGTRTAIVGPSGSGKTTLLRLVAGFEAPDAGEIMVDGMLVADAVGGVPPHRRNIGLVMQDGVLFPHLTVLGNIVFGIDAAPDRRERALALLDVVELGRAMASRRPHELSGGQQQRVALARALARRPKLMLLDEPFSALDSGLREQMRNAVAEILAAAGVTTILVTHDQTEAMSFAETIVVLRDGMLRQAGPPRQVYSAPVDPDVAAFLGQAIVLDANIEGGIARCSLGRVRVDSSLEGPARIMLRPEQIVLRPAEDRATGGSSTLRLAAVHHAGPLASVTLVPEHGCRAAACEGRPALVFNTVAMGLPPAGSAIILDIVGAAHVFAKESSLMAGRRASKSARTPADPARSPRQP